MYVLGSVLDLKIEHRGVTPPSPQKGSSISESLSGRELLLFVVFLRGHWEWVSEPHLHAFALLLVNTPWSQSELSTLLLLVLSSSPSLIIYCYVPKIWRFLWLH